MIDQAFGTIPTNPPVASYRDQPRQDPTAEQGEDFESFVSNASQQNAKSQSRDDQEPVPSAIRLSDNAVHVESALETIPASADDALDKVTVSAEGALPAADPAKPNPVSQTSQKSALDLIESRLRLASLQPGQKKQVNKAEIELAPETIKQGGVKAKDDAAVAAIIEAKVKEKPAKREVPEKTASDELVELLGIRKQAKHAPDADAAKDESNLSVGTASSDATANASSNLAADHHHGKSTGIKDLAEAIGVDLGKTSTKPVHDKNRAIDERKADDGPTRVLNSVNHGGKNNDAATRPNADDPVVRIVSADGKGKPIDITLPRQTSETASDNDKRVNVTKVETVTVVEARRYLGIGDGSNAANLAVTAKADQTWTQALSRAAPVETRLAGDTITEVNTLKLQMNPEILGSMVASLKLKGEDLTVEVRVESIEAYRQLSADQDGIVKALQDQGFSIDQVSVQLSPAASTDAGGDMDGQARQNTSANEGQREAQERDPERRSNNQSAWQSNDDNAKPSPADPRSELLRDGNFYL